LLDFVLSNSTWKGGELTAEFRQPFDMLYVVNRNNAGAGITTSGSEGRFENWLPKTSGIRNILQAFPRAARGVRRRPRAEPFSKWRKAQGRNRLIENDLADCAAPLGLSTSQLCADGRLRISNFTGLPMTDGRPGGRPRGSVRQSDLAQPTAHSRPTTGLGCRLICGK